MGGRVPCWQTPCLADTGVGTCTGKSSSCRSISTTCTENRMAFEQKISLSPFGPETSSVEHFCKTAVALSHHMTSTSATSGSCRSEMWAQSFFHSAGTGNIFVREGRQGLQRPGAAGDSWATRVLPCACQHLLSSESRTCGSAPISVPETAPPSSWPPLSLLPVSPKSFLVRSSEVVVLEATLS